MDEEQRPAEQGTTVLLTRSAAQGAAFARALAEECAQNSVGECRVLFAPLQQAHTVPATEELRGIPALLESGSYAWVSFTSAHTVRACAQLWGEDFARAVHAGGARIACVGAATARAVRAQLGLDADFQPQVQSAAGMLAEFEKPVADAAAVLVLEGSNARPTLREGLKNLGWSVTSRVLYDMVPAEQVEPDELTLSAARALVQA
uniref:uroporphyrinogen-III synthase n=1 Tax=Rothia mucilaginosa TaxID=43675 RepID=UPI0026EF01AC